MDLCLCSSLSASNAYGAYNWNGYQGNANNANANNAANGQNGGWNGYWSNYAAYQQGGQQDGQQQDQDQQDQDQQDQDQQDQDQQDQQYQYQSQMMQCSDGSLCDACEYQVDQTYLPCDSYVCGDYYTYCSDLYEPEYNQMYQWRAQAQNGGNQNNNNGQNELYQFLECSEYVNDYGQRYYVGPHCASDHYTISLGVFSDENCVNYIGETVSLSKVLGYGMDEEKFFHLPHDCISCDGAVSDYIFICL
jgi:hypothetical protein